MAELLFGHQTPCMLPMQEHLTLAFWRLRWAMWSILGEKNGSWRRLGIQTPYAPYREGGSYIGRGAVTCDHKLFSCGFLWHTLLNRCRPDLGTLKTMCHRLRSRWDENTLLNK